MRVFIGLTEIAGYYTGLRRGFDVLGVPCTFVSLLDHPYGYAPSDNPTPLVRHLRWVARQRTSRRWPRVVRKTLLKWLQKALLLLVFLWSLRRFDAFVLGYASRFGFYDLPLLKLFRRRILFVFHGSDSRAPYLDGTVVRTVDAATVRKCVARTRRTKRRIRAIERWADAVVCYPLHAHLHERPVVFSTLLGIPTILPEVGGAVPDREAGSPVRILHCPSDPEAKGTPRIRAAIASLVAKGHRIEYVELTGRPNREVLEELSRSDLVVDQLYNEAPVAGFASEAAAFEIPAITASHGEGDIRRLFSGREMFPIELCHPDEIESAISKLVTDEEYRRDLGRRAREFLEREWTPEAVATRYLRLIEEGAPPDLLFDPRDLRYVKGTGLPAERTRAMLSGILESEGPEAFCLSDKPELLARVLAFAGGGGTPS